ncbi:hypothetical protein B0T22DRAFT_110216 [Podospora appendiculata]|uniref:Uncharacterized protein n=1 Tax=Podospora appendiculata TaxID=314037 RepID=A0AAE0XLP4_9PEZI|nr:hypothetical protein B0T22DRAFT_110216 [Podospora appendiculata]
MTDRTVFKTRKKKHFHESPAFYLHHMVAYVVMGTRTCLLLHHFATPSKSTAVWLFDADVAVLFHLHLVVVADKQQNRTVEMSRYNEHPSSTSKARELLFTSSAHLMRRHIRRFHAS